MATVADFPTVNDPVQGMPDGAVFVPPTNNVKSDEPVELSTGVFNNTFFVKGDVTKKYKKTLSELGGTWNGGNAKMWSFDLKSQDKIMKLVEGIKNGSVSPDTFGTTFPKKSKPEKSGGFFANRGNSESIPPLPVIGGGGADYLQEVTWKVFKPSVGMVAKIKVGDKSHSLKVVSVETDKYKGFVKSVLVSEGNNKSRLIIADGHWQVERYSAPHQIYFINN